MDEPARILVADGCGERRRGCAEALQLEGYRPLEASDLEETLRAARELRPDLVLLELALAGPELELLRVLKASRAPGELLPVVCTNAGTRQQQIAALRQGADDCLADDCIDELLCRLEALLRLKRAHDAVLARERELARLSMTDPLTGLYNRRLLEERLREELVRSKRFGDPLSMLMIDLDHFKRINDRFGHPAGDEVLKGIAAVLRANVREIDIVTRYGGEELAVILPRTQQAGCLAVAERVWRAIRESCFFFDGQSVRVTASIGAAAFPSREIHTGTDLVQAADRALYRAKRAGRDRIGLPACLPIRPTSAAAATAGRPT
jgi:diguanylate cyclase (GGDEF)-like protein